MMTITPFTTNKNLLLFEINTVLSLAEFLRKILKKTLIHIEIYNFYIKKYELNMRTSIFLSF